MIPDLKLGGPVMFLKELCAALPGIHAVLTLTRPGDIDDTIDKILAGSGISVYYCDEPNFRASTVERLKGSHVIMYDVLNRMLPKDDHPGRGFPSVSYGYHLFDESVEASSKFVASKDLSQKVPVCTPGIDRVAVRKAYKKKSVGGRPCVAVFYGSEKSFDPVFATSLAYGLDPGVYAVLSDPVNMDPQSPGLELALRKGAKEKKFSRCPMVLSTLNNYLGYADAVADTGCIRINAEVGAAELPLLPPCTTAEELSELTKRVTKDESFKNECLERSRIATRDTDIRVSSITIRNAIFEIHM
jgi:hypothetical protein